MVPKRAAEEPKKLNFASPSPWNTLPREVHMDVGRTQINDGETTESPVDGHDQPKIYTIRDHTLEVLMHPSVLELHAVRVVYTPHGDERQMHLKLRVQCGKKEVIADVLVDTGAQVSLVRKGLFSEEFLKPSQRLVRLKVANGKIIGGGTHEATIGMKFWEHDGLNRPELSKRIVLSGIFYAADISDWDIIMGYDFMVSNAIGALPHRATLVREHEERLTWLSTDHAPGLSQWTGDEEKRMVRPVKTLSTEFNGDRGGHLMEYGMAPQVYNSMVQQLGGKKTRDGSICFPGCPAAKEVYEALAQGGLCVVKALGIEGVGAHVLAWCSRRHQTYAEQDYCGYSNGYPCRDWHRIQPMSVGGC